MPTPETEGPCISRFERVFRWRMSPRATSGNPSARAVIPIETWETEWKRSYGRYSVYAPSFVESMPFAIVNDWKGQITTAKM